MNNKAQMLLAALLKLQGHVSRICFGGLRHCIIKDIVDDAVSLMCERKIMLLGKSIDALTQNTIFSYNFSYIKPDSPPLNAMLCRTQD